MSRLAGLLGLLADKIEKKNNEIRLRHGLPEDHRPSKYREKKLRERVKEGRTMIRELRTLDELEGRVREALDGSDLEAQRALDELRSRAERVDAACEVCHAAALEEGRAQERATS